MSLFLLYMSFSILEGLAIFYLMFSFFKISSFVENLTKISIVSILISVLMFVVHSYDFIESFSSFANLVMLFLAMFFVFNMDFIKSLYVSVTSLLFVLCLQILLVSSSEKFLGIKEMDVAITGILQIIEIVSILVFSSALKKFRGLKNKNAVTEKDFKNSGNRIAILLMSIVGIFMIIIFITQPFTLSFVLMIVCLLILISLGMEA